MAESWWKIPVSWGSIYILSVRLCTLQAMGMQSNGYSHVVNWLPNVADVFSSIWGHLSESLHSLKGRWTCVKIKESLYRKCKLVCLLWLKVRDILHFLITSFLVWILRGPSLVCTQCVYLVVNVWLFCGVWFLPWKRISLMTLSENQWK